MNISLYISAFYLDVDGQKGVPEKGLDLVARLGRHGFSTYMPLEHRNYHTIEVEIDEHDGLVALVDEYWASSTWKFSEVTYALDGCGVFEIRKNHHPVPTFLFPMDNRLSKGFFLNTLYQPIMLSPNTEEALSRIEAWYKNKERPTRRCS